MGHPNSNRLLPMEKSPPPLAVLFDAYGTLFDVYSVSQLAEQLFPGHGDTLAQLWRDKQIEYSRLASMSDRYRPFSDITRAGLRFAALRLGIALTPQAEDLLMNQYRRLTAFAEVREVVQALRVNSVRTGILSNGDPEMLAAAIESAGLSGLIDPVLSVASTHRYKTDPACYALGPAALGVPVERILFVSSNGWDAIGATWFGYTTLWINRAKLPLEQLETDPTHVGTSLRDVLTFFP